jgi:hypothetical protein
MPADIESPLIFESAASNVNPAPTGWPPNSSPNITYSNGRESLAMMKRWWNRAGPTQTSTGSANAQVLTFGVAPTEGYVRGQSFVFIAGYTNTGPCTLNVNGLGAVNITQDGFPLQGGEIRAGLVIELFHDGSGLQITSGRALASLASALGGSMRNFLINPLFNVQQRGVQNAFNMTVAAASTPYTLDRWYFSAPANQASTVAVSGAVFGGTTGPYAALLTRTAGQTGVAPHVFAQTFDTDIIQLLAGQQVTISCYMQGAANFSAANVSLQLIAGTGAPTRGTAGFTGQVIICTSNQVIPAGGGIVYFSATGTVTLATRQLEFRIAWNPVGTAGAADTLIVYAPRLNLGPVDLGPDLTRIYTTELPLCQRFFAKSFNAATAPVQASGVTQGAITVVISTGSSGTFAGQAYLPTRMRALPTLTTYNPISANANWRDITNSADRTASILTNSEINFTISGAAGVAGADSIHWTADAEIL